MALKATFSVGDLSGRLFEHKGGRSSFSEASSCDRWILGFSTTIRGIAGKNIRKT